MNIQTLKADYVRPLINGWKMEMGLKITSVKTDNDLTLSSGTAGALLPDPALSNHFQLNNHLAGM